MSWLDGGRICRFHVLLSVAQADNLDDNIHPSKDTGSMKAEELMELLRADYGADSISQSGVVDDKARIRSPFCSSFRVLLRSPCICFI